MLTTKFYHADGSLWLLSEMAYELAKNGHAITVLNLEWTGLVVTDSINSPPSNLRLIDFSAIRFSNKRISLVCRWLFSSFKLLPFLVHETFVRSRYDLLVGFSPCSALYAALPIAKLLSKDSCLIYWDFFPVHNQEISGKSPRWALPILKSVEKWLVNMFSRVGCMSKNNILFFKSYFTPRPAMDISVIPVWTSFLKCDFEYSSLIRTGLSISDSAIVFVFGGQLAEGRGVIEVCEAILLAQQVNPDIVLVVCGKGNLAEKVMEYGNKFPDVIKFPGEFSRTEYFKVLKSADVGVVATVEGVSAPTFPSKSLDYMACFLPILAAVESASDFSSIVEQNGIGFSCKASDIRAMADAVVNISSDRKLMENMGINANAYLCAHHAVERVAKLVIGESDV